jgi:hypothetical protein
MRDTIELAREAKVTPDIVAAHGQFFTRIEHLVALARADERAAPVHDENQAFIDSLPTDSDDKMYMQIHHWARQSYARHKSLVAGQMITAGDASDTHIIWATLRWAKENAPPAPAPVPLTDEQIDTAWLLNGGGLAANRYYDFARSIEAAHGITGKGQP